MRPASRPLAQCWALYMRTLICLSALILTGSFQALAAPEAEGVFLIASRSVAVIETDTGALGSAVAYYSFGDSGTGFLTNCHVLRGATSFTVSHKRHKAIGIFIFGNPEYDLCLVGSKLTLPVVSKRSFFSLRVGEAAYAVGAPRGLELSLTNGIVSQLRGDPLLSPPLLIQTTAPISPGSSGGGLFDEEGQLIGITTFFFKESQSLNFAVSINMANGLSEYGKARSLEDLSKPDTPSLLPASPSDSPPVKIIGFEPDKPKGAENKPTAPPTSVR